MNEIFFFVQVRLGSSRLPGKALLNVTDELSLLDMVQHRLQKSSFFMSERCYFLTSNSPRDDRLVEHFIHKGWQYFRGDEQNVFARFHDLCVSLRPKFFFRICADNPFLEPEFVDRLGEVVSISSGWDYVSFCAPEGTPVIRTHYGFFAELISGDAFLNLAPQSVDQVTKEHVTPVFYNNPQRFSVKLLPMPSDLVNSKIRLTTDTFEDLEIAREIFANVGIDSNIHAVYDYLEKTPEMFDRMVIQIERSSKK